MKNLLCFTILAFITISCSNSDENRAIDPTKLAKVIFSPTTIYEKHWNFYPNGLLKEITEPDGNIIQDFIYDGNDNLTISNEYNSNATITTHTFTYDVNNYITSINGVLFPYDSNTNSYITNVWETIYPDISTSGYTQTIINSEKLLISKNQYITETDIDGTYLDTNNKATCSFQNNNLVNFYKEDYQICGQYIFDSRPNPFKHSLLPICRAFSLVNTNWLDGDYNSINNTVSKRYCEEDPEHYEYIYEYNSNNLPITKTTKWYSNTTLEGTYLSAIYYYQGDIIP